MGLTKIIAGSSVSYMPFTMGDALEGTSRAGYRYIDLTCSPGHCEHAPLAMDQAQIKNLQSDLERHNLKVSSLNAHTGLMSKEGIKQAKQTIDLAVKLGAVGVVNSIAGAHGHDEDLSQFMNHVGEAGDYAREHGVMIGIEVHGDHTGNGKDSLAVIREVNHPMSKLLTIPRTVFITEMRGPMKTSRWLYRKLRLFI